MEQSGRILRRRGVPSSETPKTIFFEENELSFQQQQQPRTSRKRKRIGEEKGEVECEQQPKEIEDVREHRVSEQGGKIQFLVKWKGFLESQSTWEEDNVVPSHIQQRYYDRFSVGNIVWVKFSGHPYWPSRICDPSEGPEMTAVEGKTKVYFLGDETYNYIARRWVRSFDDQYEDKAKVCQAKKKMKEGLLLANESRKTLMKKKPVEEEAQPSFSRRSVSQKPANLKKAPSQKKKMAYPTRIEEGNAKEEMTLGQLKDLYLEKKPIQIQLDCSRSKPRKGRPVRKTDSSIHPGIHLLNSSEENIGNLLTDTKEIVKKDEMETNLNQRWQDWRPTDPKVVFVLRYLSHRPETPPSLKQILGRSFDVPLERFVADLRSRRNQKKQVVEYQASNPPTHYLHPSSTRIRLYKFQSRFNLKSKAPPARRLCRRPCLA